MIDDKRRKQISDTLNNAVSERQQEFLRDLLEMAQPPFSAYEHGQAGFVVDYDVPLIVDARPAGFLTKAAVLIALPDIWGYGLWAAEDCPNPRRRPQGQAFWMSQRTWKGSRDPELKHQE